jgi:hypothetical protein
LELHDAGDFGVGKFLQQVKSAGITDPPPPLDIPCVMEMAKKSGLEFLPPPGV